MLQKYAKTVSWFLFNIKSWRFWWEIFNRRQHLNWEMSWYDVQFIMRRSFYDSEDLLSVVQLFNSFSLSLYRYWQLSLFSCIFCQVHYLKLKPFHTLIFQKSFIFWSSHTTSYLFSIVPNILFNLSIYLLSLPLFISLSQFLSFQFSSSNQVHFSFLHFLVQRRLCRLRWRASRFKSQRRERTAGGIVELRFELEPVGGPPEKKKLWPFLNFSC